MIAMTYLPAHREFTRPILGTQPLYKVPGDIRANNKLTG